MCMQCIYFFVTMNVGDIDVNMIYTMYLKYADIENGHNHAGTTMRYYRCVNIA